MPTASPLVIDRYSWCILRRSDLVRRLPEAVKPALPGEICPVRSLRRRPMRKNQNNSAKLWHEKLIPAVYRQAW
jgi:hypothetical protein